MTFDEWWDKEGCELFSRADGWRVAKAAWNAATKNAAPQAVVGQTTAMADEPGNPEPGPAVAAPSPTPRTDALVGDFDFPWSYQMEMLLRHAERLERELNAAQAMIAMFNSKPTNAAPLRWNPNTSIMGPHNYLDDLGMKK